MLRQVCATHLMKVRQTFAGARVIELCFDASQVSIRNHDIFAVYALTGSGGASTNSEGISTYLPPIRVPELAWRGGTQMSRSQSQIGTGGTLADGSHDKVSTPISRCAQCNMFWYTCWRPR